MSLHQRQPLTGTPFILAEPFTGNRTQTLFTDGRWLDEVIADYPNLPDRFHDHGKIYVQQGARFEEIDRRFWARGHVTLRLRLKPQSLDPVKVYLVQAPGGGGGSKGRKSLLTIVGTIALLAVATAITGGAAAGLLGPGTLLAGSTGAQALAAAVTFGGRLLLALAAKPAGKTKDEATSEGLGSASATGNVVTPGQSFDYVAGRVKVFPKMAAYPLVELDGEDELVEACYMLEGPHELKNPKVEGTALTEVPGLSFTLDEGIVPNPSRIIARYGYQTTPQIEMKAHQRDKTDNIKLANQGSPEASLPQPVILTSKNDPDEIWLQPLWPANFGPPEGGVNMIMPFRLKMRIQGTAIWINLPELMFHTNTTGRMSKKIVLKWAATPPTITDAPLTNGAWHSFHTVPAQNLDPIGVGAWAAHASFNGGAGYNQTLRVERRQDGFIVYLDPTVFPRGNRWDLWMQRGCITSPDAWAASSFSFNPATYTPSVGSLVYSLFDYWNVSSGGVFYTANYTSHYTASTVESCIIMRFASVWNQKPLPKAGNATIELRGRNINVGQLSVEAAALVKVWNGTTFDGLASSDNPADHFYEIATGFRSPDPMNAKAVNAPLLGQWHAENAAANRKVALVLSGREWTDALDAVASAGLAKRNEGRLLGVSRSRDTATLGVPARQIFTHLNMKSLNWQKSFAAVPDAVRVTFRNRALDFEQDPILVIRPGLTAGDVTRIIEQETDAIADEAQVIAFYKLYLNALWHRDHVFTMETWFESVASEPGDIIEINHLMLSETHTAARIIKVLKDGAGDVTALELDMALDGNAPTGLEAMADLTTIADMAAQGLKLGARIMTGPGLTVQPIATVAAGDGVITFEAPFTNADVAPGQLVAIGVRGQETRRFELVSANPSSATDFTLTLAPEAPEMWNF